MDNYTKQLEEHIHKLEEQLITAQDEINQKQNLLNILGSKIVKHKTRPNAEHGRLCSLTLDFKYNNKFQQKEVIDLIVEITNNKAPMLTYFHKEQDFRKQLEEDFGKAHEFYNREPPF